MGAARPSPPHPLSSWLKKQPTEKENIGSYKHLTCPQARCFFNFKNRRSSWANIKKNIEAARRISVMQYLETYHPGELVRKTDKEYCTKTHSSLVITPANGLFHWFSQSKGGNNALDYLVKVEGMDFVSAVRLLSAMAPAPVSIQTAKASSPQQHTTRPFELPTADRNTEAATAYLMHRGISPKVLR